MKKELRYFDICPKIIPADKETRITIKQLGLKAFLDDGEVYNIKVIPVLEAYYNIEGESAASYYVTAENGTLVFSHAFGGEQEYFIYIYTDEKKFIRLSVYALKDDLLRLTPLKGDLHAHSTVSDGAESPEIVAAHYRKAGYDFTVISDHRAYKGSVMAQEAYKDVPAGLNIVNGEEIHAPGNHVHIVAFGTKSGVTEIFNENPEQYNAEVGTIMDAGGIPGGVNAYEYASSKWVCDRIREAGGIAIFPHPFWIIRGYSIRETMIEALLKSGMFDAFELLGGIAPKANNMQTAFFDRLRLEGFNIPIVGSGDSHSVIWEDFDGSTAEIGAYNQYGFTDTFTVVFAEENTTAGIIGAIKDYKSVAVDLYKRGDGRFSEDEPFVHGDYRLAAYALFLLKDFFPLHDELCYEQGRLMKAYAADSEDGAAETLHAISGRMDKFYAKYIKR